MEHLKGPCHLLEDPLFYHLWKTAMVDEIVASRFNVQRRLEKEYSIEAITLPNKTEESNMATIEINSVVSSLFTQARYNQR